MDRPWRKELRDVLAMGGVVVSVEAIVDPALRERRVPAGWAVDLDTPARAVRSATDVREDIRHAGGLAPRITDEPTDGLNAARQLLWLFDLLGVPWGYVTDYSEGETVVQLLMAQLPVKPILGDQSAFGFAGAAHALGVPALNCAAIIPDRPGAHDEAFLAGLLPLTLARLFGQAPANPEPDPMAPLAAGNQSWLATLIERFRAEGLRQTGALMRLA